MDIKEFEGRLVHGYSNWSHDLFLVEACTDDEKLLLFWRNEEKIRQQFFITRRVTPEEHHNWFMSVLKNPDVKVLILYLGKHPIGVIRFECQGIQAIMSYSIDCNYQGLGLGDKLISMSVDYAERKLNISQLCAETKKDNEASQKVLLSNGFQQTGVSSKCNGILFVREATTPPLRGVLNKLYLLENKFSPHLVFVVVLVYFQPAPSLLWEVGKE